MKFFSALFTSAILGVMVAVRAAEHQATCADPNLATTFFDLFSSARTAHIIRAQMDMINYNSLHGTTDDFQFLVTPTGSEVLYLLEDNGKAPTASGFTTQGIVGYAYSTQVCGSVPLFSANNAAASDNYWTTNQANHDALLALGWVDTGIPFYTPAAAQPLLQVPSLPPFYVDLYTCMIRVMEVHWTPKNAMCTLNSDLI